jgi:hypothetical protein
MLSEVYLGEDLFNNDMAVVQFVMVRLIVRYVIDMKALSLANIALACRTKMSELKLSQFKYFPTR